MVKGHSPEKKLAPADEVSVPKSDSLEQRPFSTNGSADRIESYSEEWLASTECDRLQDLLAGDVAALNNLRGLTLPPGVAQERAKQLEVRIAQLKNAIARIETADFWDCLLAGSLREPGEEVHPAMEHANARFYDCLPDLRRKKLERLERLNKENLTRIGRAFRTLEITQESLGHQIDEWIAIYKRVAKEFKCPEILSRPQSDLFRNSLMSYVGHALLSRKDEIERSFRATGEPRDPPRFSAYKVVGSQLLDHVNRKLRVLETGVRALRAAQDGNTRLASDATDLHLHDEVKELETSGKSGAAEHDHQPNEKHTSDVPSQPESDNKSAARPEQAISSQPHSAQPVEDPLETEANQPGTLSSPVESEMIVHNGGPGKPREKGKGDPALLAGHRAVTFRTAERYLGISERHRQNLVKDKILVVEGKGQNRKITRESLIAYLPAENPQ